MDFEVIVLMTDSDDLAFCTLGFFFVTTCNNFAQGHGAMTNPITPEPLLPTDGQPIWLNGMVGCKNC
jgi:hypothetical protein